MAFLTHTALLDSICDDDCNPAPDVSTTVSLDTTGDSGGTKLSLAKRRSNQQETETYYFTVRIDLIGWLGCVQCIVQWS